MLRASLGAEVAGLRVDAPTRVAVALEIASVGEIGARGAARGEAMGVGSPGSSVHGCHRQHAEDQGHTEDEESDL